MSETFECLHCHATVTLPKSRGGSARKFCCEAHSKAWHYAERMKRLRAQGLSTHGNPALVMCPCGERRISRPHQRCYVCRERPMCRCGQHRKLADKPACRRCMEAAKANQGVGNNAEVEYDAQAVEATLARRYPNEKAVRCWCGMESEVVPYFDCRLMETVAWEVCPKGHYTRVKRRCVA